MLTASGAFFAQNFTFNYATSGQRVCQVTSTVDLNTPSVTIQFLDAASNSNAATDVFRRPIYGTGADRVQVATALPAGTTQWTDTDVNSGEAWEYKITRNNTSSRWEGCCEVILNFGCLSGADFASLVAAD